MRLKSLFFLLVVFCIASCASKEIAEKVPEMYWPLPPEKPRIKFVDIVLGSVDSKMRVGKLKSFLFGAESDVRFTKPFGVAATKERMYVTDIGGIYAFNFEKGEFKILGSSDLKIPSAIAVAGDRLYVGDVAGKGIYEYDAEGKFIRHFAAEKIDTAAGIALDGKRQRIIVSDSKRHSVSIYSMDGKLLSSFGKRGTSPGEFNIPYGVTVDKEGRIYVVDSGNFRLQIFDENGKFLKMIGSIGANPGNFARPKGVAIDSDGDIYVLDSAFGNFQIFDFDGNTLLAVGNTGNEPAEFMLPSSIYIDERDKIYIADQINKRIQIFQYLKEPEPKN